MNALVSDPTLFPSELSLKPSNSLAPTCQQTINSIIVDHFMWDYRRDHDEEMNAIPFHKIRCIYY